MAHLELVEAEVHLAVELLRPQLSEEKPDLGLLDEADEVDDFALQGSCRPAVVKGGDGLGNFTLPIACSGASVLGVEGSQALVERGCAGAVANGLADRAEFAVANLFECTQESLERLGHFDKMLIDPPREGAIEVVKALPADGPRRIVYVSCNPATLARDAAELVQAKGYSFKAAGVVNMFPHTGHVESVAVFERA